MKTSKSWYQVNSVWPASKCPNVWEAAKWEQPRRSRCQPHVLLGRKKLNWDWWWAKDEESTCWLWENILCLSDCQPSASALVETGKVSHLSTLSNGFTAKMAKLTGGRAMTHGNGRVIRLLSPCSMGRWSETIFRLYTLSHIQRLCNWTHQEEWLTRVILLV